MLSQMRQVDSLINDSRKRLLPKIHMGELFKVRALHTHSNSLSLSLSL